MEKMLCTKSNRTVIIMTILHFLILGFILINFLILYVLYEKFQLNINTEFLGFCVQFYIFYVLFYMAFRYIVLIRNAMSIFLEKIDRVNVKLIFYGNLFSFIFYVFALATTLRLLMALSIFLLLPEVVMTTIFNLPVLYRATTFIVKNKYFKWILKLILIILLIIDLYLIFNINTLYDILYSRVILP